MNRFTPICPIFAASAFLFLAPFFMNACRPGDDPIVGNPTDSLPEPLSPEIIWQVPLSPDTSAECMSMKPVVYQNGVLYSRLFYLDGYELLDMVEAQTGRPLWSWTPLWPGETLSRGSRIQQGDKLYLTHWDPYYCIDLNNGHNIWSQKVGNGEQGGDPRISLIGNFLYTVHSGKALNDSSACLVRANTLTGAWDTLLQIRSNDAYRPDIFPPVLWVSPGSDSLIIFQVRYWNFSLSDGKVDLLAYNLNERTPAWEIRDFEPNGNSSVELPLVLGDKLYFLGEKTMFSFDAATGREIWRWTTPKPYDNLLFTNMLAAENKIFIQPTNERMLYGLDPETGTLRYSRSTPGPGAVNMSYYKGVIYYSSQGDGCLYAVKLSTGAFLWRHASPNRYKPGPAAGNAVFDELTVSPEHGCIFVGDRYFFMAVKLPE